MVGAVSLLCPRPQATEPSRLTWFSTTGSLQLGLIAATTSSNPNIEQLNNIVERSKPFIGSHGSLTTSYD
ncbi:hypothetical protein L1987_87392 [Smallanthus sonchifolius]|nr:hypothetical protein L1987_87392 [Smallanthus sonchifolius]